MSTEPVNIHRELAKLQWWTARHGCPFVGRAPNFVETLWWEETIGDWFHENSYELDCAAPVSEGR